MSVVTARVATVLPHGLRGNGRKVNIWR